MSVLHKRYYYLLLSFLFFITVQAQMTLSFNCGRVDVPQFEDNSHSFPKDDYITWNVLPPIQESQAYVEMRVTDRAGTLHGPDRTIYTIKLYKDTTMVEKISYYDIYPLAAQPKGYQLSYHDANIDIFKQTQLVKDTINPCLFVSELVKSELLSSSQNIDITDDTLHNLGISISKHDPKEHPRFFFELYTIEVKINDQYRIFNLEMDHNYFTAIGIKPYSLIHAFLTKYFTNFKI